MRKLLKQPTMSELLGSLSQTEAFKDADIGEIKEFVRCVMYNGKTDETYIDTRVRIYNEMKVKTSMSLPPDPSSLLQAVKRVQLQVKIWSYCSVLVIPEMDPEDYGWRYDPKEKKMVPVWFIGPQVPPSFNRKPSSIQTGDTDGDDEQSEDESPKKKRRRKKEVIEFESDVDRYEADDEDGGDTRTCTEEDDNESAWEVSDFYSDDDSDDDWNP